MNTNDTNAKAATRKQMTRCRREFSRILKFKAVATKKRTVLPTVFTHSPMHTDARRNSISGTHAELWQNGFASGGGRRKNAKTFVSAQLCICELFLKITEKISLALGGLNLLVFFRDPSRIFVVKIIKKYLLPGNSCGQETQRSQKVRSRHGHG